MGLGSEEFISSVWTPDRFRSEVIKATETFPIPVKQVPPKIDIGTELHQIGINMLEASLKDPLKRERGRGIKVGLNRQLIIPPQDAVTTPDKPNQINITYDMFKTREIFPQYSRQEQRAISMHVHAYDYPPSTTDLATMLVDNSAQVSLIYAPTIAYLILKTLDTPLLSYDEMVEKEKAWTEMVLKRYEDIRGLATNHTHLHALAGKAGWAFVRDVSKKYAINVFTSIGNKSSVFSSAKF